MPQRRCSCSEALSKLYNRVLGIDIGTTTATPTTLARRNTISSDECIQPFLAQYHEVRRLSTGIEKEKRVSMLLKELEEEYAALDT